jgi:hypothetical protein
MKLRIAGWLFWAVVLFVVFCVLPVVALWDLFLVAPENTWRFLVATFIALLLLAWAQWRLENP